MNGLTRSIQDEVPWYMLFADDMVYVDKIKREINVKLEIWRDTLRSKGFPLNKTKIEYMKCKFSKSKKKKKKGHKGKMEKR